ncbi:hypothetical protein S40288_09390 [Stachybotrys chartarum IBT 40288]|nr:hypothetical protein S40288_09390 [Stachybotrys chartarum IBT 40288]
MPIRVLDVGERKIFRVHIKPCLQEGRDLPLGTKYVTLSHCWGGVVPTKLLKTNLSDFKDHIQFDQLPKTFQDAIVVTQNLGARYLWIDSLCIIQDDEQDWQHEAAMMVDVYRNAICNLTAASSRDSSGGLCLDHDIHFTQPVKAWFKTSREGTTLHNFWPEDVWHQGYSDGVLISRGWIFQETSFPSQPSLQARSSRLGVPQ